VGEVGIDLNMPLLASSSFFQSASAAHARWNRGLLHALVDAVSLLLGTTIVAVCRSFIGSVRGPPDFDGVDCAIAALLFGFIPSVCWFARFALCATVLGSSVTTSNHRPQER
jgi:hypothetical protein